MSTMAYQAKASHLSSRGITNLTTQRQTRTVGGQFRATRTGQEETGNRALRAFRENYLLGGNLDRAYRETIESGFYVPRQRGRDYVALIRRLENDARQAKSRGNYLDHTEDLDRIPRTYQTSFESFQSMRFQYHFLAVYEFDNAESIEFPIIIARSVPQTRRQLQSILRERMEEDLQSEDITNSTRQSAYFMYALEHPTFNQTPSGIRGANAIRR